MCCSLLLKIDNEFVLSIYTLIFSHEVYLKPPLYLPLKGGEDSP